MTGKQTDQQLEMKIKGLQKELLELKECQNRYRLLVENANVGIVVIQGGKVLFANPRLISYSGYTLEALTSLNFTQLIHPEDREGLVLRYQKILNTQGIPGDHEFRIIDGHGKIRWVRSRSVRFEWGEGPAILGILVEISGYKRAKKALRENEEKLDAMLRSIGDHMSMMDKDLNIIWANETARKIFGNQIIGKKCYEVYHRRQRPCEPYPCITLRAFEDGKVHEHDTQVIGQDGEEIYFHCTANVALKDNDGKPAVIIEISRDITSFKRAEEALKKKDRELVRQTRHLKEVNTALKVLIQHQNEEKEKLEGSILMNLRKLVLPYMEKLDKARMGAENRTYMSIIKSNLENLVSPFASRLSSIHLNLTPTEIQIADLVRHGQTSKEIASALNVSPNAVMFHRKNIRKKLGLANKKTNLRSHLQSLSINISSF